MYVHDNQIGRFHVTIIGTNKRQVSYNKRPKESYINLQKLKRKEKQDEYKYLIILSILLIAFLNLHTLLVGLVYHVCFQLFMISQVGATYTKRFMFWKEEI